MFLSKLVTLLVPIAKNGLKGNYSWFHLCFVYTDGNHILPSSCAPFFERQIYTDDDNDNNNDGDDDNNDEDDMVKVKVTKTCKATTMVFMREKKIRKFNVAFFFRTDCCFLQHQDSPIDTKKYLSMHFRASTTKRPEYLHKRRNIAGVLILTLSWTGRQWQSVSLSFLMVQRRPPPLPNQ